jgi:membrane protease subunit HflC
VSGERKEIMQILTDQASTQARELGIEIVDVRVKRVDLPRDVSSSVYDRMRAERSRVAKELRARGRAEAERIRAEADKEYTVTLAKAYKESQNKRGEGDAKAAEIYAKAYNRNREFYSLYRSLQAYRQSFGNKGDVIVLEPDSEFFKYFKNPKAH